MKKIILTLTLMLAIAIFAAGCEQNTHMENTGTEQDDLYCCDIGDSLDEYMDSIIKQSDVIRTSLENDTLTQTDMNIKSQELYELWDNALNYLWEEIKGTMPEEEFEKLLDAQRVWIAEKEKAVEEAGKEVEGGSVYPLIVNGEAAKITEARVYELYELLKKPEMQ